MSASYPNVYVVKYHTESGDSGVVGWFDEYPTDGHLTAYFNKLMPDEFFKDKDGEVRYIFWEVWELDHEQLPKPVKPVESI